MKYRVIAILFFSSITTLFASSIAAPLSDTHRQQADLGPGCRVEAKMPFDGTMGGSYDSNGNGGGFSIKKFPSRYGNTDLMVNMQCFNVDESRVRGWAEFDSKSNKWEPSYMNERDRTQRQAVTKLYPVTAVNSQGYVVTVDDFTGEESLRYRTMHFCLLHPPKAICGDGDVMLLSEPKSNLLPYVFEILKTIEFIDDDSEQPSSRSPAQDKSMP